MTQRRRTRRTDAGSLPLATLLTLVASGMSTVLLATVLQQADMTESGSGRTRALGAASAGLEFGIGAIRASVNTAGDGVASSLPCDAMTGDTGLSTTSFTVQIKYFSTDPRNLSAAALATAGIACPAPPAKTPQFARITSTGVDTATGTSRTVFGTYTFKTPTNVNVPGGQIHMYRNPGDLNDLCIDAGPSIAATSVKLQQCASPVPDRQNLLTSTT